MRYPIVVFMLGIFMLGCNDRQTVNINKMPEFSGIYPHLSYYNSEGECGTGAVVPWAGRLWVITYGPHLPFGSSDKLYEIDSNLQQTVYPGSIGGTPANRMIHAESNQLFIGPYLIDSNRNIRTLPYSLMPGRITGNARHLTDPANKIYYATMEEGFYEVDVKSLAIKNLYVDGNVIRTVGQNAQFNSLLPGCHGKGVYSGQGVLVYSNNGEDSNAALTDFNIQAGSLTEWNGKEWIVVRRNQFTEVTGPGGIYGNKNPETDPIWTTGWDSKSVLLGLRDKGKWSFYRLPKASHSYDGAHGWNTEWPRIRDIGTAGKPDYLMTMHGMFWRFPASFCASNTAGIRARSSYLKVIGDFTRWNNRLVFGCDDSANKEFLNKRKAKGNIEGPGQSNSNLWLTSLETPDLLGPNTSEGAVWISDNVGANEPSEPFLFAGWSRRCAWLKNEGNQTVVFKFETDNEGNNNWGELKTISVSAGESAFLTFEQVDQGEWIRVLTDKASRVTVHFFYSASENRTTLPDKIFNGLAEVNELTTQSGLLYGLGENRKALGLLAGNTSDTEFSVVAYYELDSMMNLMRKEDSQMAQFISDKFAIPHQVITIDEASVLITDDRGRRWRLPKGDRKYANLTDHALLRICREVATERDLFSCAGTFYELPAENADGYAKIRPVASHHFRIFDYASYRGLLIMTGTDPEMGKDNSHMIRSDDGKASLWAGTIDDLWKIGKPAGEGGPWKNTLVKAGEASDPYLIGFYDKRTLTISHNSREEITCTIEIDPIGHGPWMVYKSVRIKPGKTFKFAFPDSFQSRWIRFRVDKNCTATAWLKYE